MDQKIDALIIGGGHNGLVCAFYLARAGMKVRVLEARHVVGGAAVTEEFHPGFRNSTASYTVSLLQPKIIADMKLAKRGYRVSLRPLSNFLPLGGGHFLKLGGGLAATQAEVSRFSEKDAARLPEYYAMLEVAAGLLRDMAHKIPPGAGSGAATLLQVIRQGRQFLKLSALQQHQIVQLFTLSARELLDLWFESAPIKAAFGFDAIVGNFASPDMPGSAYVLLHHVFGEVNGEQGQWGHVDGGMGRITELMADACDEAGVDIRTESPVEQVLVHERKAAGVQLADGEQMQADLVIANVGPKLLYDRLCAPDDLPDDFRQMMAGYKCGSGSFRMNLALDGLPGFSDLPGEGDHLKSGIIMAPSLDYMDQAWRDAKDFGWSRKPVVEMLIPSLVDDNLAPPGKHVASLFCQQFAPNLPGERSWDTERDAAVQAILDVVEDHAPGFRKLILGQMALSPLDLERRFGLVGGDIFHGRMSLDQLWAARPVVGSGNYRGPIEGLWMCGSGTHPGGGVTGAPGHNAAQAILANRPLWQRFLR
ncbi:Phytoene dehydrogenase-related protein [Parasphingorhabdus marina DSM 22363]|uniref:Pyridine nucleotide-disulfide oxidoreductase domain-containing protein 2 n=1 Tax=Parasphingorhabdus marina DSM 22363 TaxID=1123272 RepID=A0A1N6CNC0_9SPHN|nr:NAD(P)/FAD-dependent oxidoreductase [Parasphingorhabdus marina]SIN59997.1 Phytoene dehydrogenase-related protein [Parasphingorhabdus marina DSM 22363]